MTLLGTALLLIVASIPRRVETAAEMLLEPVFLGIVAVGCVSLIGALLRRSMTRANGGSEPPLTLSCRPSPVSDLRRGPENLVDELRRIDWFQFEKVLGILYAKQGYIVTRRGGARADGGIDLIIEKDGARIAVQCKHWKTWNVGVKAVREFLGALTDAGISTGILATLCGYTEAARELAGKHGIKMLDEVELARLLESVDARFDPRFLEVLRDTRKFCPKCEREMVLRTAKRGRGMGRDFWGCSGYPRCRFTMPAS